jgi:hypothetical protein
LDFRTLVGITGPLTGAREETSSRPERIAAAEHKNVGTGTELLEGRTAHDRTALAAPPVRFLSLNEPQEGAEVPPLIADQRNAGVSDSRQSTQIHRPEPKRGYYTSRLPDKTPN